MTILHKILNREIIKVEWDAANRYTIFYKTIFQTHWVKGKSCTGLADLMLNYTKFFNNMVSELRG